MDSLPEPRPKAIAENYSPAPFFFPQRASDGSPRLAAWSGDVAHLRLLVCELLRQFSRHSQVLFKIDKHRVPDGAVWTRFHGEAPLAKVLDAITAHERLIFQDGYTQLCVRDDDTKEYIAIDEYGLLWIYSDDTRFADVCRKCGFEERTEQLICDRGHWRRRLPDAAELSKQFVEELKLVKVE